MDMKEIIEFDQLKKLLFGDDMFVIAEDPRPEWDRYKALAGKYQKLMARVKGAR